MKLNYMAKEIFIRHATAEDIATLAEFAAGAFRDTFAADNHPADLENYLRDSFSIERVRAEFDDASNTFLVAYLEDDHLPVGYAKLSAATQYPDACNPIGIEIERLYAAKAAIGHGVGAALMRACLEEAEALGGQAIWLGVWERNVRAIRFYERWEFETVGARQFKLGSDLQNDLIMTRKLSRITA
ncbi:MAG: GNAT family N-acetyltransferase [Pseudomonadales bacterium]